MPELLRRPEAARTGIYILVGPDPDRPGDLLVYIGEADDVAARLRIHLRSETKDFFDRLVIVVSSADNLTKAHVRYIESQLIRITQEAGAVRLTNDTHPDSQLTEHCATPSGAWRNSLRPSGRYATLRNCPRNSGLQGSAVTSASSTSEQDRPDIARHRARWKKYQGQLDPRRLVFIDETWAKTNMAPLRDWAPRGQRLQAQVPHGHWKTMTFLAALRCDRIDAPCVFNGPISAESFTAYVDQLPVPREPLPNGGRSRASR